MGVPPQGGGGSTGRVSNITFNNMQVENTTQSVFINKCYFKVKDQAKFCDSSTFEFDNLSFNNISGTVRSADGINLNCSSLAPCRNIAFTSVNLTSQLANKTAAVQLTNAVNVTGVSNKGV